MIQGRKEEEKFYEFFLDVEHYLELVRSLPEKYRRGNLTHLKEEEFPGVPILKVIKKIKDVQLFLDAEIHTNHKTISIS